jgi:hypothetical protein
MTVECDEDCGALLEPSTYAEWAAAVRHWRDHRLNGGCSHGLAIRFER